MRNLAVRLFAPMLTLPRSGARSAARRLHLLPKGLQPQSLTGTPSGLALTVGCLAAILMIAAMETVRPGFASLGSLLFLPVLASAWLVGTWQAAAVSALAVATRIFGHGMSGVDFGTALSEATMIIALAVMARLAANSLVESHKAETRVREQAYLLQSLAQREQIAAKVNDATVRNLFGLSIRLQAVSELIEDSQAKQRVSAAVQDIDTLCAELRSLVFTTGLDDDVRT
jgi:hypothetical protein